MRDAASVKHTLVPIHQSTEETALITTIVQPLEADVIASNTVSGMMTAVKLLLSIGEFRLLKKFTDWKTFAVKTVTTLSLRSFVFPSPLHHQEPRKLTCPNTAVAWMMLMIFTLNGVNTKTPTPSSQPTFLWKPGMRLMRSSKFSTNLSTPLPLLTRWQMKQELHGRMQRLTPESLKTCNLTTMGADQNNFE